MIKINWEESNINKCLWMPLICTLSGRDRGFCERRWERSELRIASSGAGGGKHSIDPPTPLPSPQTSVDLPELVHCAEQQQNKATFSKEYHTYGWRSILQGLAVSIRFSSHHLKWRKKKVGWQLDSNYFVTQRKAPRVLMTISWHIGNQRTRQFIC